jgi:murein DD-endopeptidase MepM/ murein hydrolase activator NlpD
LNSSCLLVFKSSNTNAKKSLMKNIVKAVPLFLIGAVSLGGVAVMQPRSPLIDPHDAPTLSVVQVPPPEEVQTISLKRGETLSGVLTTAGIVGQELADLLMMSREHLNPRRLTSGTEITVRRWATDHSARAVEMRLNADTTVVLARNATGWQGNLQLTPVVWDTVYVAGQIDAGKTLFEALVNDSTLNLPHEERYKLATELGNIYAYTIDFSREIQPGDKYQIAYEREARPDGTARSRRILISEVVNQGKSFAAVYFKRGSIDDYYDSDGKSLRKSFRKVPLDYGRVTSAFNPKRYHPILGMYRAHLGTDYGAAHGTPVYAVADGSVMSAGRDRGYGNVVVIRHHSGYTSRYAHLSRFASKVRSGTKIKQNDVLGYVGSTGLATGPHLHYELRLNGRAVNSRTAKLPGSPPLPSEYRSAYRELLTERVALLQRALTQPHLAKTPSNGNASIGGI